MTCLLIMDKDLLELYTWILAGSQRVKIIKVLDKPKTPLIIKKETDLDFGNVSNILKLFKDKGIVDIANPNSHLGRLYYLTEIGKELLKEVNNVL